MKSFNNFVLEYRTKKAVEKIEDEQDLTFSDVKGKDAEDVSGGVWAVEEPTDDEVAKGIDRDTLNKNKKRILMHLKSNKPFFVQGEAGWGKTSIITKLAHECGRSVITVYLDKAEATDLGGIPVPAKSKRGASYSEYLMPGWAKIMWDNPKKQFLLFFDEMNQAAPDVMNALMPIVLKNEVCGKKFKNFVVGAAGNFESENEGGITELSGPLKSRFGGVITWESGDWEDAFKYLHKKWDDKVSSKFLDMVKEYAPDLFKNPRDVESFIIETVNSLKSTGDADIFDADDYYEQLSAIAKDDLGQRADEKLKKIAEGMYKFVNNVVEDEKKPRRANKTELSPEFLNTMKTAIKNGYIVGADGQKYGVSKQNINKLPEYVAAEEMEDLPAEMFDRAVRKFEQDGLTFKYDTDADFKKAGLKDPEED